MKADGFYSSMLQEMRSINMTERERARAEDGVRKSAAIVNLLVGLGVIGSSEKQPEQAS